ncbi:RNA-directed DNA polymerase, eukaryota [Tanacetum coccineum]
MVLGVIQSDRADKCVFVGYAFDKKGYKLFSLDQKKFIFSGDVKFYETVFLFKNKSFSKEFVFEENGVNDLNVFNEKDDSRSNEPYDDVGDNTVSDSKTIPENSTNSPKVSTVDEAFKDHFNVQTDNSDTVGLSAEPAVGQSVRRSSRKSMPTKYSDYVFNNNVKYGLDEIVNCSSISIENFVFTTSLNKIHEPSTYVEAVKDNRWVDYVNQEIEALNRNKTWEIIDLPSNRNPIGSKWIFKVKYKANCEVERFKAKLVAKGFNQREGIDYEETFSPVVKIVTIICILSIAINNKWPLLQFDINNAFLYGELKEDDDIIVTGNNVDETNKFKRFLGSKFLIKDLGKLKYFLGIKVLDVGNGICLTQKKYCIELLTEFDMLACKPCNTPIEVMHNPMKSHLRLAFRVLRYLKRKPGLDITFREDDVQQISTSVFVINLPNQFSAKDLWNTCKQYGYVVDAFIPNRRSKAGAPLNGSHNQANNRDSKNNLGAVYKDKGLNGSSNSYAHVVKVSQSQYVKDFASLPNLKVVMVNEGFDNIELKYMGGYWVMIKFQLDEAKKIFQSNAGIGTWFSKIQQASTDFFVEGRVAWVEIEGIPLNMWSETTFKHIASKWGSLIQADTQQDGSAWLEPDFIDDNDDDTNSVNEAYEGELNGDDLKNDEDLAGDSDMETVPDTKFGDDPINSNAKEASLEKKEAHSGDPFNIYDLLNKKKENNNKEFNLDDSLKYPLCFTPRNDNTASEGHSNKYTDEQFHIIQEESSKENFKDDVAESTCSGHFKKSNISRTGGSILQVMKELVKETKMENIDYVHSSFVGDWVPNGIKLLIISVYAPQDLSEKKMLWDYLSYMMAQWEGEVVVMGDFNEVHKKDENFGLIFNMHGADAFNMFISNAGLEEVPLGGCTFTWCHKSASKMSKLDRFLISESIMNSCPNISAITLDRYLSDHPPILMRESHYDYGPVPFRFFHYWFEMKGFDKLVEDSWKEAVVVESNAMTKMMNKLKYLKEKIRLWNKGNMVSPTNRKRTLKSDLADLNLIIDKGDGDIEIKWAIKGDENSKYYHGILNKKRSQLAIRGILVNDVWIDSPILVKREFLTHFKNHFDRPQSSRLQFDLNFLNMLKSDQHTDLERDVSKDEIKKAVWDCGTDKSPGPDGFTFGFYRRY